VCACAHAWFNVTCVTCQFFDEYESDDDDVFDHAVFNHLVRDVFACEAVCCMLTTTLVATKCSARTGTRTVVVFGTVHALTVVTQLLSVDELHAMADVVELLDEGLCVHMCARAHCVDAFVRTARCRSR
jgi:hypothetical protein